MTWKLSELTEAAKHGPHIEINPGEWVAAKPRGPVPLRWRIKGRIKAAWSVLRGRTDTFIWPEQDHDYLTPAPNGRYPNGIFAGVPKLWRDHVEHVTLDAPEKEVQS